MDYIQGIETVERQEYVWEGDNSATRNPTIKSITCKLFVHA